VCGGPFSHSPTQITTNPPLFWTKRGRAPIITKTKSKKTPTPFFSKTFIS